MLVRISKEGMRIIQDKKLGEKVIRAIMESNDKLASGESVPIKDSNISIQLVTTLKDFQMSETAHK